MDMAKADMVVKTSNPTCKTVSTRPTLTNYPLRITFTMIHKEAFNLGLLKLNAKHLSMAGS